MLDASVRDWCRLAPMMTRGAPGEKLAEAHPRPDLARLQNWCALTPVRDFAPIFPTACVTALLKDQEKIETFEAMWNFAAGEIVDFAVMTPDLGRVIARVTWLGLALGLWRQASWALDGLDVRVFASPAAWWRAEKKGVLLLGSEAENAELLRGAAKIVCDDAAHGDRLLRLLSKPVAIPPIRVAAGELDQAA